MTTRCAIVWFSATETDRHQSQQPTKLNHGFREEWHLGMAFPQLQPPHQVKDPRLPLLSFTMSSEPSKFTPWDECPQQCTLALWPNQTNPQLHDCTGDAPTFRPAIFSEKYFDYDQSTNKPLNIPNRPHSSIRCGHPIPISALQTLQV